MANRILRKRNLMFLPEEMELGRNIEECATYGALKSIALDPGLTAWASLFRA